MVNPMETPVTKAITKIKNQKSANARIKIIRTPMEYKQM
jgi:hypothetical protein